MYSCPVFIVIVESIKKEGEEYETEEKNGMAYGVSSCDDMHDAIYSPCQDGK